MRIEDYLRQEKIPYTKTHHPEAFTAQEVAATSHVPGGQLAKVVVIKAGDAYAVAICPATHVVDVEKLSKIAGGKVRLANEGEMEGLFPDVQLGAESPFGNLYGLTTYVDESLSVNEEIVFQANTHEDTIKISYMDYEKTVKPTVADFARHV
ncbi:MAG: YbaK/EbsC family protein [Planctomycetes bacterium]|nr:YbaK/EbsC family protein [Planctomycetota bacterium]